MQARVWPLESSQGPVCILEISEITDELRTKQNKAVYLFGGQYKQFVEWV